VALAPAYIGQLSYGQNGLKSTAIGSRSESGCRYLGDGFVSEDCLARLRLQESGSRDNAENLSVCERTPHGSCASGVRALVCVCGVSVPVVRACVRYTHINTLVYARARVCVRACLRECAGTCVCTPNTTPACASVTQL
jgi:hypothetical protein